MPGPCKVRVIERMCVCVPWTKAVCGFKGQDENKRKHLIEVIIWWCVSLTGPSSWPICETTITDRACSYGPLMAQKSPTQALTLLSVIKHRTDDMVLTWGSWCGHWHRSMPRTHLDSSSPHLPAGWRKSQWYCVYICRSGRGGTWLWPVSPNTRQRTGSRWGPGTWTGTPRRASVYGPSPFLHHLP